MQFLPEHVGLAATDSKALAEWYRDALGAEVLWHNGETPGAWFVQLGSTLLEIYPAANTIKQTSDNSFGGFRHLALRVASLPDATEFLKTRGVTFSESVKPAGGGGTVLFFQDPEGNLLHLVERPPGFNLLPGTGELAANGG